MSKHFPLPPELDRIFAELKKGEFASLAEVQAQVDRRFREYNASPQAGLGGLSPVQVMELSQGDWVTVGPLRISRDLALGEVQDSSFFSNARLMLRVIGELGLAKVTPSGLLARSVVATIFEQMRWDDAEEPEMIRKVCKVINEYDARLSDLRYLLHQLGLIRKRKGFLLSPEGRRLLDDSRAGELYHRLFLTGFRELNLRDERPEEPAIVRDLAFALVQVGRLTEAWAPLERLETALWLADWAGDQVLSPEQAQARRFFTEYRVIWPLVGYGLLEFRHVGEGPRFLRACEVRKTALFDRVVKVGFPVHSF